MVPVAGRPLTGAYLGTTVYQRRPRLEVHPRLRVDGAVVAEPRRQQADREGAQADEEGKEVRVGDVAIAGEVMAEVWPMDDGDEGVDQVEVVGHENVDERPRTQLISWKPRTGCGGRFDRGSNGRMWRKNTCYWTGSFEGRGGLQGPGKRQHIAR